MKKANELQLSMRMADRRQLLVNPALEEANGSSFVSFKINEYHFHNLKIGKVMNKYYDLNQLSLKIFNTDSLHYLFSTT